MAGVNEISAFGVFLEGLLSFFSPCVLPLIPLYMTYLTSDAKTVDKDGNVRYYTSKIIVTTIMFILGVSCTFFILALSVNWLKDYIKDYQNIIGIIGGTIVFIFGLGQIGIFEISFKEFRLPLKLDLKKMSYFKAFCLGFVFSFAWTPCVGPMLTNVILLAMSEESLLGNLYIFLYALGLIVPFMILGIFTKKGLEFIKNNQKIFKYVLKIAGVIMLCFGAYMIYDNSGDIVITMHSHSQDQSEESGGLTYLDDISLYDQNGIRHDIKDHQGDYVIMNFITTWCGYCKEEIPVFDEFVKENDLVAYYVMSPFVNSSTSEDIKAFYDEHDMNNDILIDEYSELFQMLGINSYPTLIVIGPDGSYIGYVNGALTKEQLVDVFTYAKEMYEGR